MSYTSPLHSLLDAWRQQAREYRDEDLADGRCFAVVLERVAKELERALSQGFHLHLTPCGGAFEGDNVVDETKACLKRAAYRLGDGIVSEQLRDSNGNTVGYFNLNTNTGE